ncbi:cupin domain-containing protein [Leptothoe kymatousa]|uniref:Cupin domain-containing protein n=1 Tax=Leptothoe kymatousa TAU-MAC 1615 TaxID=2364775 RepID=A0ABS5Y6G9_9CYAN|nr:cupin domain-containing protein [Leptothoe kymatousa]MBT9313413.1 cupin domain-containing protein [Leptothoe kymatousa TAU-MAC 1615]
MSEITVNSQPQSSELETMGVFSWPIWQKDVSEFPWHYDESETCYFLEGQVTVTPSDGAPVSMGKGDLVTFPAGMSCTWRIDGAVRKHYSFG